MVKILVGALLVLTTAHTVAGNMYIYKDKDGKVLAVNVNPSSSPDKPNRNASNKTSKATVEWGKESTISNPTTNYKTYGNVNKFSAEEINDAIDNLSKYSKEKKVQSGGNSINSD